MELTRDRLFMNLLHAVMVILLGSSVVEGQCGSHLTSSSGTIQSPNYPKPYPAGQECTWTVSVEGSVEHIRISFSAFKLQPRSTAGQCVDYVAIYRLLLNKDAGAAMEGKFCGDSIPPSIKIGQSSMTVQFISSVSVADSYTGFSLHYEAKFEDSAKVSQATAGIVAAIFCAVVFVGVGMLRCIMMGACGNRCNAQNVGNTRERRVIGTHESYAYEADFPPSYSTVMHHPERFPTPISSPQINLQRNGTVNDGSQTPSQARLERTFSLQSSSSESSNDDEDTPPPPYPGYDNSDEQINVVVTSIDANATGSVSNVGSHNVGGVVVDERESSETDAAIFEVPSLAMIMEDQQTLSVSGAHEAPSDVPTVARSNHVQVDSSWNGGEAVEVSQTAMSRDDETDEVII